MEEYILKKDLQVQVHIYRIAIFQEKDGVLYYSVFAEVFENVTFELIHGGRFESEEAARGIFNTCFIFPSTLGRNI